jgi:hypothetical protein
LDSRDIYINQRLLDRQWLAILPIGTEMPPNFFPVGSAAGFNVYADRPDVWHQFVISVQHAMDTGAGAAGGKTSATGGRKAAKTTTFVLPAQAVPLLQ